MSGDGFTVAIGDVTRLQQTWRAQQTRITPMAGQLSGMLSEITAAANAAMSGKSKAEQQSIASLAESAQRAVSAALGAVRTLSGQLSEDADKLGQTADTYRLAELMTKDHITSLAQLAGYNGPDASKIHSLLNGEAPQEQSQTEQQAVSLAFPASGAPGGGAGAGSGGGGYGGGTGTPVAPNMAASSAQVKQWVAEAIKILEQNGVPASKIDPNAIALIIQHESGGNPNAVNHTDINAQEGHPSEGLMQTIAPTFNQYSLPGHGNILNPVDNIIAGCRYAIARYGSLDNVPGVVAVERGGSYVGY